ncbi:MAG: hypothetical protein WC362_03000 [Methanoregula sp.]|jgi:hypothetical protein
MYTRDIVILANSKKFHGHCIAGKDLNTGEWVRLINNKPEPFTGTDLLFLCNRESGPDLLEGYTIPFSEKCPEYYQPENERISGEKWNLLKNYTVEKIHELEDTLPYEWLGNHQYDFADHYDRILPDTIKKRPVRKSLIFHKLSYATDTAEIIYFAAKTGFRPSLRFKCNGIQYTLKITDIKIPQDPAVRPVTERVKSAYVTIGLGHQFEAADNAHFKLVVGIIRSTEGY